MDFKKVFKEGCFSLDLKSNTKEGIIEEMVDLMVKAGKIKDRKTAIDAVLEREKKMSTGMQYGVAVPHGKISTVDNLVVAFGLKREGVDFDSLDHQPSQIFIMTISSTLRTGPHIEYLCQISKLMNSEMIRKRLLEAKSVAEIVEILTERSTPEVRDQNGRGMAGRVIPNASGSTGCVIPSAGVSG